LVFEALAFFVRDRPISFNAEDPSADLIIAASLGATEKARETERIGNTGAGRERDRNAAANGSRAGYCRVLASPPRSPDAQAKIASGPIENWDGRRGRLNRHVGSECAGTEAEREQSERCDTKVFVHDSPPVSISGTLRATAESSWYWGDAMSYFV
jgi:hypothetical protein